MHAWYVFSVFVHILAATTWLGGMLFLVLVVVPWLRAGGGRDATTLIRETGQRFRAVGWTCFGLLLVTGTFQLYVRGVRFGSFVDPVFLGSAQGRTIVAKLAVFAFAILLSLVHDFSIGPRATDALARDPGSAEAERLRALASRMGRLNLLVGLVLFGLAVMIVRGVPF